MIQVPLYKKASIHSLVGSQTQEFDLKKQYHLNLLGFWLGSRNQLETIFKLNDLYTTPLFIFTLKKLIAKYKNVFFNVKSQLVSTKVRPYKIRIQRSRRKYNAEWSVAPILVQYLTRY